MNRVEFSAEKQAGDINLLSFGESALPVACTPAIVATAAFVASAFAATAYRAYLGFEAGADQAHPVDPGADLTAGELVATLRKSMTN